MHGLEQHVLPDTGARVGNPCLGCFIVRWVSGRDVKQDEF